MATATEATEVKANPVIEMESTLRTMIVTALPYVDPTIDLILHSLQMTKTEEVERDLWRLRANTVVSSRRRGSVNITVTGIIRIKDRIPVPRGIRLAFPGTVMYFTFPGGVCRRYTPKNE